jgi:hypothetical protein
MGGNVTIRQFTQFVCEPLCQALDGGLGGVVRRVPTVMEKEKKNKRNVNLGRNLSHLLLTAGW